MLDKKIHHLRSFLEKLDVIRKKYEDIESKKDQFNIFTTLLDPTDEVNLHSQFIYSLLKFQTNNEYRYLNAFCTTIESKFEYYPCSLEIHKELHDIDILLIDKSTRKAVIIENKINAHDSNHKEEGQLEKYYRIIVENERIPEDNVEVYYLTLDGHEPSQESVSTSKRHPNLCEKIQCISYPNEIKSWLQECMRFVYDKSFQRETILQYIKLINDMTNDVDIEERIEIKKLIGESKSNLESAKLLIDNINHLHWHTIADLWNGLADGLTKRGYELAEKPTDEDFTDIVHGSSRKKNKASLIIEIKTTHPFNIRIEEYNDDWLYYGVIKDKKIPKQYTQAFKTLIANDNSYDKDDNWYIWKYPSINKDDRFDSWKISDDATFNLIKDDFRQRITTAIIDDIDKFINDIENSLTER